MEAVFNTHPEVLRTALVGVGAPGAQRPVLCVETVEKADRQRQDRIRTDLLQMAAGHPRFNCIDSVLFHPSFPVDIRHNAKIGRERLARWAEEKLS